MSKLTIKQAAELSGKPDKTLYRWIKTDKLSATTNALGQKVIDIAELERVCGKLKTQNPPQEQMIKVAKASHHDDSDRMTFAENSPENPPVLNNAEIITLLRSQVRTLENQLATANQEKASLLRTLESQSQSLALPAPEPAKKWWQRIRFATLV